MTTMQREIQSSRTAAIGREIAILAGLCAFLLFYGLGSFGLVGADEPRYAQIAREMLERRDWVVPVLNGKPWLEKPILYYWQAMLSYSVFGVSDWAARVPNAINATAMVFAIYLFARRFLKSVALDAGIIAASCAAVIGFGRAASTDMPLTAMFTIAMLAWLTWHLTARRGWLAVFYLFIALGTLAKGPVAPFLAALIIIAYAALQRDLKLVTRTLWWPGILLFLIVALPWYFAVQARVPEFFRIFFLEHNLARYGTNLYRHHQPFWYYLPVVLLATLPWVVLSTAGAVRGVRTSIKRLGAAPLPEEEGAPRTNTVFVTLWALLPVIFFSFSGSKLPGYILPAIPGFILLTADWLAQKVDKAERPSFALMLLHLVTANIVLAAALLSTYIVYRLKPTPQAYAVAGALAGMVLLVSIGLYLLRGMRMLRLVTLLPLVIGLGFVLKVTAPALDSVQSARPVARQMHQEVKDGALVAGFGIRRELEYGLTFYLNRPVSMYERAEIPPKAHILVTRSGGETELAALIPGRRITRLQHLDPQGIDVYRVEAAR